MKTAASILIWAWWALCMTFFFLLMVPVWLLTLPFDRRRKIPNSMLKGLARLMFRGLPGWSVEVVGADPAKVERPVIVVANHQSFLDLPLAYFLPWPMIWVAKRSLFYIPVLGWMIRMTGHLSIDRGSRKAVHRLHSLAGPVREGMPAMIFPEGTRTADGSLGAFHNGAFKLAEEHNFTLLPLVLEGGYHAMPPGEWRLNPKQKFYVSVLDPVNPGEFDGTGELKRECHRRIREELHRLRNLDN